MHLSSRINVLQAISIFITISLSLLVNVSQHASCQEYQNLALEEWTEFSLTTKQTVLLTITNPQPGQQCTGPCEEGFRWIKISAHSQALPIHLAINIQQPLPPSGTCNGTSPDLCTEMQGTSAAVVARLGTWSAQPDDACYIHGSIWVPYPSPNMYAGITLLSVPTSSLSTATVGVFAQLGSGYQPMPGGCASTSTVKYDTNIDLSYSGDVTMINYQDADFGSPLSVNFPWFKEVASCTCDYIYENAENTPGSIKYEVFRSYLSSCGSDYHRSFGERDLLLGLSHMTTPKGVKTFGVKIRDGSVLPTDIKLRSVDTKPGQGVIYNILVTDTYRASIYPDEPVEQFQSVYAPAHTYACSLTSDENEENCHNLADRLYMAICIASGILGLFLAIFGLRFYVASMGILVGLAVNISAYALLSITSSYLGYTAILCISGLIGGVSIFPLLLCWRWTDWNGLWVILQGAMGGFLVACLIFATPLGELDIFTNDFNFWMTFACFTFTVPVLFVVRPVPICVFSTSLIGCYCILYAVDFFVGSDFNDMFLNILKRITDKHFAASYTGHILSPDFNGCSNVDHNIGFLIAWLLGTLFFCIIQVVISWKHLRTPRGQDIHFCCEKKRMQADETHPLLSPHRENLRIRNGHLQYTISKPPQKPHPV